MRTIETNLNKEKIEFKKTEKEIKNFGEYPIDSYTPKNKLYQKDRNKISSTRNGATKSTYKEMFTQFLDAEKGDKK